MKLLSFLSIGLISILACGTHVKSSLGYKMYEIGSSSSKDNDLVSKLQEQNLEIQRLQKQNSKLKHLNYRLTRCISVGRVTYGTPEIREQAKNELRDEIKEHEEKIRIAQDLKAYKTNVDTYFFEKFECTENKRARLQAEAKVYRKLQAELKSSDKIAQPLSESIVKTPGTEEPDLCHDQVSKKIENSSPSDTGLFIKEQCDHVYNDMEARISAAGITAALSHAQVKKIAYNQSGVKNRK